MIAFNYFCISLFKQLVVVSEMTQIKIYKFQTAPLVCSEWMWVEQGQDVGSTWDPGPSSNVFHS